jgi:hypothetical protein
MSSRSLAVRRDYSRPGQYSLEVCVGLVRFEASSQGMERKRRVDLGALGADDGLGERPPKASNLKVWDEAVDPAGWAGLFVLVGNSSRHVLLCLLQSTTGLVLT